MPTSTCRPADLSRSIPAPRTRSSGSLIATTTRLMPADTIASAHGVERCAWVQGSRLTYMVPAPAFAAAAASASSSAWGSLCRMEALAGERSRAVQDDRADHGIGAGAIVGFTRQL